MRFEKRVDQIEYMVTSRIKQASIEAGITSIRRQLTCQQ
jgi:hypothetical protein